MFSIFPALKHLSTDECESGAGLVVAAGDTLHLQLKVHLRWFASSQVGQGRVSPERSRQEVVGLSALILQEAICEYDLSNKVTPLLLLQGAEQRGLRSK